VNRARDVAGALCGREERRGVTSGSRSSGGAPGSLTRSRMRAASLEVTPGSSFADVGHSTHSGATPPRSRAGVPPVRSHRPPSRSRRHVGRRGARRARSLRRCRSATTGRSRARCPSRSLGGVVMAPPSTHGEALRGNQEASSSTAGPPWTLPPRHAPNASPNGRPLTGCRPRRGSTDHPSNARRSPAITY